MYNREIFERARNSFNDKPIEVVRKERLVKRIADLERELEERKRELKNLEKEVLLGGIKELQQDADARHIKLSKKDVIIRYYNARVPIVKIAETLGTTEDYVRKVLSVYRKENGLEPYSKSAETKRKVKAYLEDNVSVGEIAVALGITPQYVNQIKTEYMKERQMKEKNIERNPIPFICL